jgi:hypothetical protein
MHSRVGRRHAQQRRVLRQFGNGGEEIERAWIHCRSHAGLAIRPGDELWVHVESLGKILAQTRLIAARRAASRDSRAGAPEGRHAPGAGDERRRRRERWQHRGAGVRGKCHPTIGGGDSVAPHPEVALGRRGQVEFGDREADGAVVVGIRFLVRPARTFSLT